MSEKKYIADYPALAQVKGLAFRHFAGEKDYQLICDLWNEIRKFYGVEWVSTVEDTKKDEEWRKNFDIREQHIFVEMNGEPIGYFSWSWDIDEFDHLYNLQAGIDLLEEYWNSPIPQIMMQYQEEKVIAMTENLTDMPRVIRVWCKKKAAVIHEFYRSRGYSPSRYFFKLSRPIDKPVGEYPMPEGLEIREAKPEHYRKIWDANHAAFRDHWGFSEPTEEMFIAWQQEKRWFQPHLWKIAWDGDEVAGMVGNYVDEVENKEFNRKRAYTEEISVGRKWRKRGLAKALLAESIRMFQAMGEFDETTLSVDADNPNGALKLYTDMGYEEDLAQTSMVMRKKI
jgi:ribosomal protein S18 acetylase RimI-like enzyme